MYASTLLTYEKVAFMWTDLGWYVPIVLVEAGLEEGLSFLDLGLDFG